MPACHICGALRESLFKSLIEGTSVSVCESCSKFGRTVETPKSLQSKKVINRVEEIEVIEEDYFLKIKNAREKKGLTQEELAKLLAEKESSLHHIEAGQLKPTIVLAKKFEKVIIMDNGKFVELEIPPTSSALQLLQRLRDEAHRFALSYHHLLRRKKIIGK